MKHFLSPLAVIASCLALSSCATIIIGTRASIRINGQQEEPVNIVTATRNYEQVMLPYVVKVPKKKLEQTISVTSEHYTYQSFIPGQKTNGWIWGNIVIGGLIGLGIDALTGGAYAAETKSVDLQFKPITQPDRAETCVCPAVPECAYFLPPLLIALSSAIFRPCVNGFVAPLFRLKCVTLQVEVSHSST